MIYFSPSLRNISQNLIEEHIQMINLQLHVTVQKPSISELHAPGTGRHNLEQSILPRNYHHHVEDSLSKVKVPQP